MDPEEALLRSQQGRRFREELARDADSRLGMAWWNDLTERERSEWMDRAGSAVPADAWEVFKRSAHQP